MEKFNIMAAKKYQDEHGNTKTQWVKIGSVIDKGVGDDGKRKMFGNLDCTPNFEWDGSINIFEQEQSHQGGQTMQQPQQQYRQPPVNYTNAQGQPTDEYGNPLPQQYQQPQRR